MAGSTQIGELDKLLDIPFKPVQLNKLSKEELVQVALTYRPRGLKKLIIKHLLDSNK